jgi:hypothetical protein
MPTMRKISKSYTSTPNYGLDDCLEEWPTMYRTKAQINGRRSGGMLDADREGLNGDDIDDLSGLRYEPVETGVGCATHGDPDCLCDVVITQPVVVSALSTDYSYAELSGLPHGGLEWWLNILAVHDALTGIDKMVSASGTITKKGQPFAGTDVVRLSLDFQNDSLSPKQISEKWGITDMNQLKYFRRKAVTGSGRERRSAD